MNNFYAYGHCYGRTGKKNPCYGRTGEKNPMFGRTGEKHPNYGKPLSAETKEKISKSRKEYYRLKKLEHPAAV
jgi:hypothetical protein